MLWGLKLHKPSNESEAIYMLMSCAYEQEKKSSYKTIPGLFNCQEVKLFHN